MIFYTIILPIGLLLLFFTFFIVKQQSAAIVERFGKFVSVRQSGLQVKIPIIDRKIKSFISGIIHPWGIVKKLSNVIDNEK